MTDLNVNLEDFFTPLNAEQVYQIWENAHQDGKIEAVGANNRGLLPDIDGRVHAADVARDTQASVEAVS